MSGRITRRQMALGFGALVTGAAPGVPAWSVNGRVGVAPVPAGLDVTRSQARTAVRSALAAAVGVESGRDAVRAAFRPSDVVGIKVNCLAGRNMSPRQPLVRAFAELLVEGGLHPKRLVVFERSSRELEGAGFRPGSTSEPYRCEGIDNRFDRTIVTSGAIGSLYAELVAQQCTALVSFGVVKDHDLAGVSAGLKNWYGVIHNPNKYHDGNCDPYVADVVRHEHIRTKLRLTVLDGGTAQFHGGPAFRSDAVWPLGRVVVSTDPVAADVWAWRVIDRQRRREGLPTLAKAERAPRFIATAAEYGLGVGDPSRLQEVGA